MGISKFQAATFKERPADKDHLWFVSYSTCTGDGGYIGEGFEREEDCINACEIADAVDYIGLRYRPSPPAPYAKG